MKKFFALLLIIPVLLFSACNAFDGEEDVPEGTGVINTPAADDEKRGNSPIHLPYSTSDSLHPFKARLSMNRHVTTLIYDSLYRVDGDFRPVASLAEFEEISGQNITITLRKAVFSDGKSVTAKDVAASFSAAKKSGAYKTRLANFSSCKAQGDNTVIFRLASGDIFAAACLDFPILPANYKDRGKLPPIGSGRFVMKERKGEMVLTPNPRWREKMEDKTIILTNITDVSTLAEGVGIGAISYAVTDLADGKVKHVTARTVQLPLNNLLYLALGGKKLQDPLLRQAISVLINREDLTRGAFQGNARPSSSPFNPAWFVYENPPVQAQNREAGQDLIKQAGRAGQAAGQGALVLLVNKSNSMKVECARRIMNTLQVAGIRVTVKELGLSAYKKAAAAGQFDMLLGEVRLTNNMDLSPLLKAGGGASYGINTNGKAAKSYSDFRAGKLELDEFLKIFDEEVPFVPIAYRHGLAYYDRALRADTPAPFDGDVYWGIWEFRTSIQ
ncbi:MAG: ABC transporter substrate-binding protein [Oscillospiraceae bacterium]|nr:ABC transporter substrate-binding protein [Oscillospiraceae bacterium]